MENTVKLKDGTEAVIRPLREDDVDRSYAFFQALPEKDRQFLRMDVSSLDFVKRRIRKAKASDNERIVAVQDDKIVADGLLELEGSGWKEQMGELRLIVSRSHRRKGLGLLMARELYELANKHRIEEIVVKMMRPQVEARSIFQRLGFKEMIMIPDYVRDLHGKRQDLIVMRCNLDALWKEMEDHLYLSDWRRAR